MAGDGEMSVRRLSGSIIFAIEKVRVDRFRHVGELRELLESSADGRLVGGVSVVMVVIERSSGCMACGSLKQKCYELGL